MCATVVTCCISGVWKALSKNSTSRSQTQRNQVEAPNRDDLIPRPPSQYAVTSPTIAKRPQAPNNIYTLQSLPRQHMRPHVSNSIRNGHARKYSLSTPAPVVLTPSMFPPIGTRAYSFRDKSSSSHSSDSAFVQYSAQTSENCSGTAVVTEPRVPTPLRPTEGERNARDTPV